MVHILGVSLRDTFVTRYALTQFYGIGHHIAHRLCARLQIHDKCKVKDLTPFQVTGLASFLSSPSTAPSIPRYPLASLDKRPFPLNQGLLELQTRFNQIRMWKEEKKAKKANKMGGQTRKPATDPLSTLTIESELKREVRENIAHQRTIGSYVGKRHAMHLPVRGQNTQSNAKTAKKLNQLGRY